MGSLGLFPVSLTAETPKHRAGIHTNQTGKLDTEIRQANQTGKADTQSSSSRDPLSTAALEAPVHRARQVTGQLPLGLHDATCCTHCSYNWTTSAAY